MIDRTERARRSEPAHRQPGGPAVTIVDPSIGSRNAGDEVIVSSILELLRRPLGGYRIYRISSHDYPGIRAQRLVRESEFSLVCGSNLLGPGSGLLSPWRVSGIDAVMTRSKYLLTGVGWIREQRGWTRARAYITRALLSTDLIHAVRDPHSLGRLSEIGVDNVELTGCPSTWHLHEVAQRQEPGERAIVALNGALDDTQFATELIRLVDARYNRVSFFAQMPRDEELIALLPNSWNILGPNLWALEDALAHEDVDYVGTRLHCGVRAMQLSARSFIIEADHRAGSVCSVVKLRTFPKSDLSSLADAMDTTFANIAEPPSEAIDRFMSQFASSS